MSAPEINLLLLAVAVFGIPIGFIVGVLLTTWGIRHAGELQRERKALNALIAELDEKLKR